MSSPNLFPTKRTFSPFSKDSTRQKELQKQTQRFLLTNQSSNQFISNQLCQNNKPADNSYNGQLLMSPRGKISTQSKRIQTLTNLKRDISPESLKNTNKKNNNNNSSNNNLSCSPNIYSLAHIPYDQQDTIIITDNKIINNNYNIKNDSIIPLKEGFNCYEETPKFKINKSENIFSIMNKPLSSIEKQGKYKDSSCASCFSFNHDDISNDDDTIQLPTKSITQQNLPQVNSEIKSNNITNNSEIQIKSPMQTKKHVSFCPQIISNVLLSPGKQQDINQYQAIQTKSCLGENKNQLKTQNNQIQSLQKHIEVPQVILSQPIFASFAPQEEYSQQQDYQNQASIEILPEEINIPMEDYQKSSLLHFRKSLDNSNQIYENIDDEHKSNGQYSKLNMLREKLVKPQGNSSIAKYIKASSIKKASSQEFIEIPSTETTTQQQRDARIPLLLHQLKNNLSGDHQQKTTVEITMDQIDEDDDQDKCQQKYQFQQQTETQIDSNIIKENPLKESPKVEEKLQVQGQIFGENYEKVENHVFQVNNYDNQGINLKADEIILSNTKPDVFKKQQAVEVVREKRNEKSNSLSIPSWSYSQIENQNIKNTNSNIDNIENLLQKQNNSQCKAAVISLDLKSNYSYDTIQQQKPTSNQNIVQKQHNVQKSCVIHLEPFISEFKQAQINTNNFNNRISEEPLTSIRLDTPQPSQQSDYNMDCKNNYSVNFNNDQKQSEKYDQQSTNNTAQSSNQPNPVSKQSLLTLHSANSSNINNTTMASSTETLTSVNISETATTSQLFPQSQQSQEYFTTSFLKPSPMPIINCQFTNHLHKKSSITSSNYTNTKQDSSSSSPAASYLALPKKNDKNQPATSKRQDSSLDFSQYNLNLNKNTAAPSITRPQPAVQPSPSKIYSSFIRQSFIQPQNRNFNNSQENILEDYQSSKKDNISSSASSKSSSLVRSSSPSKVKSNPYDIQPQKIKPTVKMMTENKGDFGMKKNSTSQHNSNQVYSLIPGYKTTQPSKDSHFRTPNRDNFSNKTQGLQYPTQTKTEQEFSNYQLSQNNLEKEQIPSRRFNSVVQLPYN